MVLTMGYEYKDTQSAERQLFRVEPCTPEQQRSAVNSVLSRVHDPLDAAMILGMLGLMDTVAEMAEEAEGVIPDQFL
jgi:hypothetical protein